MTTQKGEQTYNAIIQAAKNLFYERGYVETYCADIAKEAGIKTGLIHYHFKNKGKIALAIFSGILEDCMAATRELLNGENQLVKAAAESRMYWYMVTHFEPFKRFLYEISLERIPLEISTNEGRDYIEAIGETLDVNQSASFSDDMLKLFNKCSMAVEIEILIDYVGGMPELTEEKMVELDLKTLFQLMHVPDERINEALARSKVLFKEISMEMSPAFELAIK